jgi:hypothetical protein
LKLHTTQRHPELHEVELCPAYWAAVGPFHPRSEATVVEVVAAGEEVCDQLFVGCRRVRRRGGGCRDSARGGVRGIDVVKITKADDASVCH